MAIKFCNKRTENYTRKRKWQGAQAQSFDPCLIFCHGTNVREEFLIYPMALAILTASLQLV
ncbi:MAG: hypothetical protein RL679_1740 [Bacteroidota bacterium]